MDTNAAVIVGSILNGILLPVLLFYIRRILIITDKVVLMEDRFNTSLRLLDDLVHKVEKLLRDNTVNKEQLVHVKEDLANVRKKVHSLSSVIMRLEIELNRLKDNK